MRIVRGFFKLLVAIVLLAVAAFLVYRQVELPKVDGQLTLAGLGAPVDVVRDAEGIPHLYAANEDDAWFALGFVHAQDRLWQMELNRRTAAGRLSEVLGEPAVEADRFLRTLGVARNAQAIAGQLDAPTQKALARYAAGVNANLESRRAAWPLTAPPEFVLTRAPMPESWAPSDTIGWLTMMAWDLSGNWATELMRMRLSQRLTKQQIDEFVAPYPGNGDIPDSPLPTADYVALYRRLAEQGAAIDAWTKPLMAYAQDAQVEGKGSNNWVVSGARSASGKPLLANDPHLDLSAPSIWYLAQVSWPGQDVIGATLPGVPFVVIGRNKRIGWGLTNTGPDTQDLYVEELRESNGTTEARTPTGWQPLETRTEVIRVKDRPDVTLTVRASRHGPLISDVSRTATDATRVVGTGRYAIAFQWTALRPDDRTAQAGFAIGRATDWTSFVAATRDFHAPQQNLVYADVAGNIGFIAPGRVPVRKPDNDLMGQAPAPGWEARYDWDGFVPFDRLPRLLNPPAGEIVTANHRVIDDPTGPYLTSEWAAPFRARRIESLIDAKPKHDLASFAAIQHDVRSLAAARLMPLLMKTPVDDEASKAVLARLSVWDGTMAGDRMEPLVFAAWMRELSRLVMQDELGADLMADYWDQRTVFMIDVLSDREGRGRWCDDTTTPAVETCADLQKKALTLALDDLTKRIGPNRDAWRWDQQHFARSEHRPFARVPALARWFDLRAPVGGDSNTVNVGGYRIRDEAAPFVDHHGPSLRMLLDFDDLERSRFIQTTGQPGDRLARGYGRFVKRWQDGETVPMMIERAHVESGSTRVLRLTP